MLSRRIGIRWSSILAGVGTTASEIAWMNRFCGSATSRGAATAVPATTNNPTASAARRLLPLPHILCPISSTWMDIGQHGIGPARRYQLYREDAPEPCLQLRCI